MKIFKVIAPILVVTIWSQSLVSYSRPVLTNVATATPQLRSESQLRSEASLYDTAIREISKGITIKLDTLDDLKAAIALLTKQIPNLKFNRSKLVVLGLSDTTFASSVKERTRDSKSTEAFAKELAADPNAILKLNGASALRSRIGRSLEDDTILLRTVAARLKKAAEDIKAKIKPNHSTRGGAANSSLLPSFNANVIRLDPSSTSIDDIALYVLIDVAIFASYGLLVTLVVVGSGAITGGLVIAGAVFIIARLVENIGTEKGRDKVAACQDAAKQTYDQCAANAAQQCCGLSVVFMADCLTDWLINSAACLLS